MENLQNKMRSSGHTLESAPFMRLSQPPASSPVKKGRAYEDWGTSILPSNSQQSASSTNGRKKGGLTHWDGNDVDILGPPNDSNSPDELDFLSSPYQSPESMAKGKGKFSAVAENEEEVPEYLRQVPLWGLSFKKNKAKDPSATPKASQPSKPASVASSPDSVQFVPSKPSQTSSKSSTSTTPDENQSKSTIQNKLSGPPPLGMTRLRTVPTKVLRSHTANVDSGSPGSDSDAAPLSPPAKKRTRPKPKPAKKSSAACSKRIFTESENDTDAPVPSTSKGKTRAKGKPTPQGFPGADLSPVSDKATTESKGKVKTKAKPTPQEFPGADLSPVSDKTTASKGKTGENGPKSIPMERTSSPSKNTENREIQDFPMNGTSPPSKSIKKHEAREFLMVGTSPQGTESSEKEGFRMGDDSPPRTKESSKKKGKGKQKQKQDGPAAFPPLSPLASDAPPSSSQGAFPVPSPLSSPARAPHAAKKPPWLLDLTNDVDGDKGSVNQRALEPFPMNTQISRDNDLLSTPKPRAFKRSSEGSASEDGSAKKRHRMDQNANTSSSLNFDQLDASQVDIDNLFLDPSIDPKTLCPWCDGPLPTNPTPHLSSLIAATRRKSYKQPRPTNPLGLKAPLSVFISVCQRHRFETHQVPLARAKGWPTRIDFDSLRRRVEAMRGALEDIIEDGERDLYELELDEMEEWEIEALGPRWRVVFWVELVKEVRKKGSRVAGSLKNQFGSFEKTQPGYYGELGSIIIQQTLYNIFPPATFDPNLIAPLNPTEFIQRILVPEVGVKLIMEDMHLDVMGAVDTLRQSAQYGTAMYPGDGDNGAGEEIVKERAAARRKELEEEERAEEELMRKMSEAEDTDGLRSDTSRRNAKSKRRGAGMTTEEGNLADNLRRGTRVKKAVNYAESDSDVGASAADSDSKRKPRRQGATTGKRMKKDASRPIARNICKAYVSDSESAEHSSEKPPPPSQTRPKPRPRMAAASKPDSDVEIVSQIPRIPSKTYKIDDSDSDDFTPQPPKKINRPPLSGPSSSQHSDATRKRARGDQGPWLSNMREQAATSDANSLSSDTTAKGDSWRLSEDDEDRSL